MQRQFMYRRDEQLALDMQLFYALPLPHNSCTQYGLLF